MTTILSISPKVAYQITALDNGQTVRFQRVGSIHHGIQPDRVFVSKSGGKRGVGLCARHKNKLRIVKK